MRTGTTSLHDDTAGSPKPSETSSQVHGVIENPLFERSSDVTSPSGPPRILREMSENQRDRRKSFVQRSLQRSKSVKEYVAKSTASFFGLDEDTEQNSFQRWTERRRRLLSKRWGELKSEDDTPPLEEISSSPAVPQQAPSQPQQVAALRIPASSDGDTVDAVPKRSDSKANRNSTLFQKHRRKEPAHKIMVDGLGLISNTIVRRCSTRNFWPIRSSHAGSDYSATNVDGAFNDEQQDIGLPSQQFFTDTSQLVDDVFFEQQPPNSVDAQSEKLLAARLYMPQTTGTPTMDTVDAGRTSSPAWSQAPPQIELPSSNIGMKRIWNKLLGQEFQNFDRRQYGMGVIGKSLHRKIRQDRITSDVKQQLEDIDDHRPFFTYWVTTVQILVLVISLAVYGFGPFGVRKTQRSGEVMVTSLHLQQVDYFEPDNFWIGPRSADLVHLGAKFTPCMRRDKNIFDSIVRDREQERDTACCVRNDQSGCVQTSRDKCSELISSWKKWDTMQPGPPRWMGIPNSIAKDHLGTHKRLSGSVCGQDPRYCNEPASVFPYEWPDDITKWPICRAVVPGQVAEPHMSCEIVGRPCCIGIYGQCHITTKEYCDFVKGFFHEEAALCSQVSCLDDICGMIPFHNPDVPDQFYRIWTSLFLHAGILHLLITVIIQYFIMTDLEKLIGALRISIIYIMSGVGGNLASAIFVPYRAEVGPAGSQFGLLACLFVEVIHCWKMLKHPGMALLRLGGVALVLFLVGLLPWIDNYAHIFGFLFGFLLSYALLPFVSFGTYDKATKVVLIWVCLFVVIIICVVLLIFFYVHPIYECSFCKYLNCIPLTADFCENQDIVFKRPEY
ncbi:inactive rhomboid protein 1 isoform X2 [Parasteatoda tepidariorum]|uniref:inactive rhomboid protein 1 isoform X2 n=1 Tax=Parasteatoda tepidariorum TaxID=114398 RepID=UPI00077FD861|nr:inactive rhomboid protein 1 [Parasteatoda tepidariorum]XP_042896363.1 inactive rhomboid protein 1 [Parasteatoda tepidariorum]XP_042896364.1 inactive rhomboid protein 1 [Parasteatoda tepidariorum]